MDNEIHDRRHSGIVGVIAIGLALLGTALWLSILMAPWHLASGLLDARDHLKKSQKSISAGATKVARYETLAAQGAVDRAREGLDRGGPAFDLLSSFPVVGDVLDEAEHLVSAAEHSANAALGTLDIAQNALKGPNRLIIKDPENKDDSQIRLERVEELSDVVAGVRDEVQASQKELEAVDLDKLPRRLQKSVKDGIDTAEEADLLLADAEAGFEVLPGILGADGKRQYILGFQNSAEQRGTGGAMLRFAILSFAEGKPTLDSTDTVYEVDKDRNPISIPLPEDAWYVREITDAQRFGNANWSPDWPLSATLTIDYMNATPGYPPLEADGFILMDPNVLEELIPGTGPYRTEPSNHRISASKVVNFILYKAYAKYPIAGVRRKILNQVVAGFEERLFNPDHPTELVKGMGKALSEKHMQIWMADPKEQAFIERMNWDGSIQDAKDKDYVYVVQQNVSGSKLDYFADQTTTMDIELDGDDSITRTEMALHNGVFLPQPRYSMGDAQTKRTCLIICPSHRPMLNLYVPGDAERLGPPTVNGERVDNPVPATWPATDQPAEHTELGKKVWSGTLVVPPGQDGSLAFDYRVPGVVRTVEGRRVYHLVVQHQPKVRPETLVVRLTLPDGASAIRAKGWKRDGDRLVWDKPLTEDLDLEVSWQE